MTASHPARPTKPRVWVTRAEPGAARTAARLRDMGFEPLVQPLLEVETLTPPLPDLDRFAALVFTSANGVAAFAALTPRRDRPVFTVGETTATAARTAGFVGVRSADGDLADLARLISAELSDAALLAPQAETPAGDLADALATTKARDVTVETLTVYRTIAAPWRAPSDFDAVLIHSPRAGRILAAWLGEGGRAKAAEAVYACISSAAAAPLASIGLAPTVAERPDEATLSETLKAALGKRDAPV